MATPAIANASGHPVARAMLALLVLHSTLVACTKTSNPLDLPVQESAKAGFTDLQQADAFTFQVECPPVGGGTGLLRISRSDGKAAIRSEAVRMDMAVAKNGFTTGEFVTMSRIAEKTLSRIDTTDKSVSPARMKLLGALRLGGGERFKQDSASAEWVVEGLESGVNYYCRMSTLAGGEKWTAAQPVRIQGPICPSDEVKEK